MRSALGLDPPDGDGNVQEESDPASRKALFLAYMDFCCVDPQGTPFKVDPVAGFLARNGSKDGVGDVQGCGEFNPVLLFSKSEKARLDREENKQERDQKNQPNRRVMVLLFRPGAEIDNAKWPCPAVKQGTKSAGPGSFRMATGGGATARRSGGLKRQRHVRVPLLRPSRLPLPCEQLDRAGLSHISLLLHSNSGSILLPARSTASASTTSASSRGPPMMRGLSLIP